MENFMDYLNKMSGEKLITLGLIILLLWYLTFKGIKGIIYVFKNNNNIKKKFYGGIGGVDDDDMEETGSFKQTLGAFFKNNSNPYFLVTTDDHDKVIWFYVLNEDGVYESNEFEISDVHFLIDETATVPYIIKEGTSSILIGIKQDDLNLNI